MIEEGDITENAALTDDEISVKAMRLGYKWHYPGRIRIQQILAESFSCDWKRRQIITDLIIYYGLGKYADSDENDLLISIESVNALKSSDPIQYIKKLNEEKKRPFIQATNAIFGDNNSGIVQGQNLDIKDTKIGATLHHEDDSIEKYDTAKPRLDIKVIFQYMAWIAGIAGAVLAYYKFFYE